MERSKQKSRKDKPYKYVDTSSPAKTDEKTFKENLKIREILRTVKMNSSMRLKAPRGSKVMQNDFSESEDIFEDTVSTESQDGEEQPSATNTVLNNGAETNTESDDNLKNNTLLNSPNVDNTDIEENNKTNIDSNVIHKSISLSEGIEDCAEYNDNASDLPSLMPSLGVKHRDRKLSLDHTRLSRSEGLSQSEADLHSIGKLPLERKSSFFRKKMDSFLRNTSEIFKRQSLGSKSVPSPLAERRGSHCSHMSVSLQSLNENTVFSGEYDNEQIDKYQEHQGSVASLRSTTTARSSSSISVNVSDRPADMSEEDSLAGSRQGLGSQPLSDTFTGAPGLNDSFAEDSLLNTRAISMSSGLDSATNRRRRNPSKASKFNRVTWLASESLTEYFRSLIQDENSKEQANYPLKDTKGRRLSYVRAVSGEDPSQGSAPRSQDSSLRRKKIPKNDGNSGQHELENLLADFSKNGIPPLFGFSMRQISGKSFFLLDLLYTEDSVDKYFHFDVSDNELLRYEVLKELIYTESLYIHHLKIVVKIFVAAAHALQGYGVLDGINTSLLFLNFPDILNANIRFWEETIYPMLKDAEENNRPFNPSLLMPGFYDFAAIFDPYEEYMQNQSVAVSYLKKLLAEPEFMSYLNWCYQEADHRLQLSDMLAKPMQRITKYTLILEQLRKYCGGDEKMEMELIKAEQTVKSYISLINRSCRQKQEMDILDNLKVEPYDPEFKADDDIDKAYKSISALNLHMPMLGCAPHMMRCLVHQGDLRFKDNVKEFDAHIILMTDVILICKKLSKTHKNACHWKLQRPKVLLNKVVPSIKPSKITSDPAALIFVILDEHGSAKGAFKIWDASKEAGMTLKVWESKVYEAMMSYALTKWYHKYPVTDPEIVEQEYNDEAYRKQYPEICAIEKKARFRVAATLFPNRFLTYPEAIRQYEPQTSYERERGPIQLHTACQPGLQHLNAWQARGPNFHPRKRTPNAYSEQLVLSLSGSSHEDSYLQRSTSSTEQCVPQAADDRLKIIGDHPSPSITVNVVGDNDFQGSLPAPPTLVLETSSPNEYSGSRCTSAGSDNTLRVASPTHSMVLSLPDINAEFHHAPAPLPQTASEKLYRSHQELMQRNRLAANQSYLSPGNRGSSYPPPSPTRPLKRGLAFSYSFRSKTPPLTRSKNVFPQSVHTELQKLADVPRKILGMGKSSGSKQRTPSPSTSTGKPELAMPSTSSGKPEKKKSIFQRRSKDSTMSASPDRTRGEASDETDYDADDDRSRRSSKSEKVKHNIESINLPRPPE